jgi:anaerobic selenocysteine-containing dehydrogenase
MEEIGLLEMNSVDARERGIRDGDMVRVFNRRGEIILKARLDGVVQQGVVSRSFIGQSLAPEIVTSTSSLLKNLLT